MKKKRDFVPLISCTCRITLYTDDTCHDSWLAHDAQSRSDHRRKAARLPKGAWGAKEARLSEPTRSATRQRPAAASCCEHLHPAAAAGLPAAGSSNEQREGWFDPRNSQESGLRKHEGAGEESAPRQVQGSLDRVWWRRASASGRAA